MPLFLVLDLPNHSRRRSGPIFLWHPFNINKPSTKTKTKNHYFLIHYNAIIYEKETRYVSLMRAFVAR